MIYIDGIYKKGQALITEEHDAQEKTKVGTLRGGSTGALMYGKTPIGMCARKAYLRYKGIPIEAISDDRHLMFAGGITNEDIWADILTRGLDKGWSIKREEEIPIAWDTPGGHRVTGRPDLVLLYNDIPKVGIELKQVSSLWTAKDVLTGHPKVPHLLQAGHYAYQLGVPWELWYTSRVDFSVSREGWQQSLMAGLPNEVLEWRENKDKYGKITHSINKILPFRQGYKIEWRKEQLWYAPVGTDEWTSTIITWPSIAAFFDSVGGTDSKGVLPPRPVNVDAAGAEGGYSMCDVKYCPLSAVCDKDELVLSKWMASVKKAVGKKS